MMVTISFDKNVAIKEPEVVEKLVEVPSSIDIKFINKELTSAETMARSEELLKRCLSRSKNF
jgi:hypothetical protein